jgi:excisionase family DNA binding protein
MPDRRGAPLRVPGADDGTSDGGTDGRLLTAEEVAALLSVTPAWVYEQSRAGRIPTVTLGRYRRYRREAIDLWIEELERSALPLARRTGARIADARA